MFAKTDKPVRIALNKLMHDNYAFFCPVTLLHLSLSRPLGMITVLSDSIERGLKAGTLIDVDNKIDLEHHCFIDGNNQNQQAKADALKQAEEAAAKVEEEAKAKTETEEAEADTKAKSKGKKADK